MRASDREVNLSRACFQVVVIGGSSRVPIIKEQLMKTMERESLNLNLNGDEAAALGAGFYAAGLSPSFRVRGRASLQNCREISVMHGF